MLLKTAHFSEGVKTYLLISVMYRV